MLEFIAHRINTINALKTIPQEYGVEIDIRSYGQDLILEHEPFIRGELFEDWLAHYKHGTLILNVKEEGLEAKILSLMEQFSITNFFLLDQSFPFLIKWLKLGETRSAVRFSEFESIETILALKFKPQWVWVDCFSIFPLTAQVYELLKSNQFKLCLVSPELHGRYDLNEIKTIADHLQKQNISFDAICTKTPETWKSMEFYG